MGTDMRIQTKKGYNAEAMSARGGVVRRHNSCDNYISSKYRILTMIWKYKASKTNPLAHTDTLTHSLTHINYPGRGGSIRTATSRDPGCPERNRASIKHRGGRETHLQLRLPPTTTPSSRQSLTRTHTYTHTSTHNLFYFPLDRRPSTIVRSDRTQHSTRDLVFFFFQEHTGGAVGRRRQNPETAHRRNGGRRGVVVGKGGAGDEQATEGKRTDGRTDGRTDLDGYPADRRIDRRLAARIPAQRSTSSLPLSSLRHTGTEGGRGERSTRWHARAAA
ncbi:hypothetical protein GGS23DRAFT_355603 [Durotheca rogersii]|uniref:uncharacterized protein n=1 Tax=Durotheca rogersii TaxID=419775 RepID=UPI00221E5BA6|nr:uncharacterized protein GGS23DRAFT_355603 [Durotheca rogersii]KAI5865807.1 hypothetical protein GGS23DRAFT_355603 [Durotheca rogersii]